jgi:hypothetical protein
MAQFADTFSTINPEWIPNRYNPAGFESVIFDGDSRLGLTIDQADSVDNRPVEYSSTFYNIQGRQRPGGITGLWRLSAQVYVSSAFNTTTGRLVRAALWGHTGTTDSGGDYMILGFTNASTTDPLNPAAANRAFRFRVFDSNFGDYIDLGVPVGFVFDAWHTLSGTSTGTTFEYRIDGVLVHTKATSAGFDLMSAMVQGYNFGEAGSYSVYWDNVIARIPGNATCDFNGDGQADMLWRNTSTGLVASWLSGGGFATFGVEGGGWVIIDRGDFDGDGKADVLWHNTTTGAVASWTSGGGFTVFGVEDSSWTVIGTGDFDGDGKADVLWHDTTTGLVASWTSGGGFVTFGVEGGGWTVINTGDFDGDGKADVLWHNTTTGLVASWTSGGGFATFGVEGGGWVVIDRGDFDGDGKADVLWHNTTTGAVASWLSGGGFTVFGVEDSSWTVIGTGDFDGDGKADVLWHNTTTGLVASWVSSGGFTTFGVEGGGWAVVD